MSTSPNVEYRARTPNIRAHRVDCPRWICAGVLIACGVDERDVSPAVEVDDNMAVSADSGTNHSREERNEDRAPIPPTPGGTARQESCADGMDNDGDKLVDCADPECDGLSCRDVRGACDLPELCAQRQCPSDGLEPEGVACRPAAGDCDIEETCRGVSPECPEDGVSPALRVCRPAAGPCEVDAVCTGDSPICTENRLLDSSAECRAAAGECDVPEMCTGLSAECPADALSPALTVCREVSGPCEAPALCTGASIECPQNSLLAPSVTCREAAGSCDTAVENCTGASAECPADVNECSATEYCSGSACLAKRNNGQPCERGEECASDRCVEGLCCDLACDGPCRACNIAGAVGQCVNRASGTDVENGCGQYTCGASGECNSSCQGGATSTMCDQSTSYCTDQTCANKRADGLQCPLGAAQCLSGECVDGFCCGGCNGLCERCVAGICMPYLPGSDPEDDCGNYTCNGSGACFDACIGQGGPCDPRCDGTGAYCTGDLRCVPTRGFASACDNGCQCSSNSCILFACGP